MADVKWIKIPADFFESEAIKTISNRHGLEGNTTILLYLHLLCSAYKKNKKGIFSISDIALTDAILSAVFDYDDLPERLKTLQDYNLIIRNEKAIQVFKFWEDKHDRNSSRYKDWRMAVFVRDGFRCKKCGTKNDLQAHHIEPWANNKKLRYSVQNGVTLCRKCHLEAHGGCWRGN